MSKNLSWRAWMHPVYLGSGVGTNGTLNNLVYRLMVIRCRPSQWSWQLNGIVAESQFDADKFARHCLGDIYAGPID